MKYFPLVFLFLFVACKKDPMIAPYKTEKAIIIVMDGSRYSETWGEENHSYIPRQSALYHQSVLNDHFYNEGETKTVPGHTAMCTGRNQDLSNGGAELPDYPSFMQHYRQQYPSTINSSWVISSKDKLEVLANCNHEDWKDQYQPNTNCGVNGLGTGYRSDSITFQIAMQTLQQEEVDLMLINFREPDYSAHQGSWENYLSGIQASDQYIDSIMQYLLSSSIYKGKTTVFVTNDHGRHLDGISSGFTSHGDYCDGCRHIYLSCYGPDFKKDYTVSRPRGLQDIPETIGELMGIRLPYSKGTVMRELFH